MARLHDQLTELGWILIRNLTSVHSLRLYRATVADAERRPDLGRLFYDSGPKLVRALAAQILQSVYDEPTAKFRAATFISLVLGDAHLELTLGYDITGKKARFAEQIEEAVQAALRD